MPKVPPGLRQRGKVYYGRWRDEHGEEVERRLSPDLREATKMRAEAVRRVDRIRAGLDEPDGLGVEVGPLIDQFLADKRLRVSAKQARMTEGGLRRMIDLMGAVLMRDVTADAVSKAMIRIVDDGGSHRNANKHMQFMRTWLLWCRRKRVISRDPTELVEKLPEGGRYSKRPRRRLTAVESDELQEAADATGTVGDAVAVVLGTGMRLEEALRTTWGDLGDGRITVPANRAKNRRERAVWIGEALEARLRDLRHRRAMKSGQLPGRDAPVLVSRSGKAWSASGAYRALRRAIKRSELPHRALDGTVLDWHALRHTYATMLGESGASESVLMSQLGWSSPDMAQIYVDRSRSPARQAVADLERLRAAACAGKTRASPSGGDAS